MVTFGNIDQQSAVKALADGSLLQLYRSSAFAPSGVTALSNRDLGTYFERGEAVTLKRAKDYGEAQDFDPRSGTDATVQPTDFVLITMLLDRLFTSGFNTYSSDADVAEYVLNYSQSTGGAVRKSFDNYLYNRGFREWSLAASGAVSLSGHAPLAIVFRETDGGVLEDMSDAHLRSAGATLGQADVPEGSRYARINPRAAESLIGDITPVNSAAIAQAQLGMARQLFEEPAYMSRDFSLRGFMTRGSNAIAGQAAVTDTGNGNATEAIGAIDADTTLFFDGDQAISTPLGAVRLTVTQAANLDAGIAVGKIARLGPDSGAATAYGVILRVDAANKFVWLVPYNSRGQKLVAAQLSTATDKFGVPEIGAVNTAHHREHLAYATRLLTPPSPGSGAIAEQSVDIDTGLTMQVFKGSYNVHQFKEGIRSVCLCGSKPTDYRKGVLMLSA